MWYVRSNFTISIIMLEGVMPLHSFICLLLDRNCRKILPNIVLVKTLRQFNQSFLKKKIVYNCIML